MRPVALALAVVLAAPCALAACPPLPDRSAELDPLYEAIRGAPNEMAARAISGRMWEIWTDAPDEPSQALLDRGMAQMRASDAPGAVATFDRLTGYCPDWAEGWNQRAFVYFLNGEFAKARDDLIVALERNPRHVGALSGLALTYMGLGEDALGQEWLRKALKLNPWLAERRFLVGPPPEEEL